MAERKTKSKVPGVTHSAKPDGTEQCIRLCGVRQNNLKGFDLDLPLGRMTVITGLSGSGKSSLAFETLYAEGQRRYVETFTPYARQFFDRMDKPAVDRIENIPPAIAIEQRNAVRTSRSTVGTMTEVCDHMKVLWPHLAQLHCRKCGTVVRREPPQVVWESLQAMTAHSADPVEATLTFDLPLSEKMSAAEQLDLLGRQGFRRLLFGNDVVRIEDATARAASADTLTVVADRLRLATSSRSRFVEACESAYHFGGGRVAVRIGTQVHRFSQGFHCARCDLDYSEPSPSLFSFNHPVGACPTCKGFGRVIGIDLDLAVPDRTKALAEGVVKPWQTGMSAECQQDLLRAARKAKVPVHVAFQDLSEEHQRWVLEGDPGYVPDDPDHSWPKLWYGVRGYFRWLESKAYKMHVRVLLSRYRSYKTCPDCRGNRFNPDSLLYRLPPEPEPVCYARRDGEALEVRDALSVPTHSPAPNSGPELSARNSASTGRDEPMRSRGLSLSEFYALPIRDAHSRILRLTERHSGRTDPLGLALQEVRNRLGFLVEVGLGYLTLDRTTRTLSGGETERVNLTTCLGTRLVNTLYILDEPSVGLHPRDTQRLVGILHRLRDTGNTVVVVEHEPDVMRAADELVDLGPGHGESGGNIVFQGPPSALGNTRSSQTADYLTGRRRIPIPRRRPPSQFSLRLTHATAHNLRDLAVDIPLGRLVCLAGVSGSGKTTLVREVLLPLLGQRFTDRATAGLEGEVDGELREAAQVRLQATRLSGWEALGGALLVDQSPLGRTPRSNPAVYVGAFDEIRTFFAASPGAMEAGLDASAFSFNSAKGQCDHCRGAGFEKIEMQFLSDVFIRCPACQGRRYREHVLKVTVRAPSDTGKPDGWDWSIGEVLSRPVEDAVTYFQRFPESRPARRAAARLQLLCDVGLGYLRCGQAINTLSGGESQRLKLASHLAESAAMGLGPASAKPTLFVFDEPTTGLHFEDIRILLIAFQRLVDAGHTVLVIEHNLEVLKCADWLIELGPEAGDLGGQLVIEGTPETVAAALHSPTGRHLAPVLAASN
ncbi:MAG: excinuclease ABC subunit UvrA [Verrucomicrobiota bacterium]